MLEIVEQQYVDDVGETRIILVYNTEDSNWEGHRSWRFNWYFKISHLSRLRLWLYDSPNDEFRSSIISEYIRIYKLSNNESEYLLLKLN